MFWNYIYFWNRPFSELKSSLLGKKQFSIGRPSSRSRPTCTWSNVKWNQYIMCFWNLFGTIWNRVLGIRKLTVSLVSEIRYSAVIDFYISSAAAGNALFWHILFWKYSFGQNECSDLYVQSNKKRDFPLWTSRSSV